MTNKKEGNLLVFIDNNDKTKKLAQLLINNYIPWKFKNRFFVTMAKPLNTKLHFFLEKKSNTTDYFSCENV